MHRQPRPISLSHLQHRRADRQLPRWVGWACLVAAALATGLIISTAAAACPIAYTMDDRSVTVTATDTDLPDTWDIYTWETEFDFLFFQVGNPVTFQLHAWNIWYLITNTRLGCSVLFWYGDPLVTPIAPSTWGHIKSLWR